MVHRFITIWNKTNLIKRISIGIGIGVLLAIIFPPSTSHWTSGPNLRWRPQGHRSAPSLCSGGKRPVSAAERTKEQYENGHLALPPGNLCGGLGSGSGQLLLSH